MHPNTPYQPTESRWLDETPCALLIEMNLEELIRGNFRDYFIGLIAFDERSNEGMLSNIVSVYVDSNDIAVLPEKGGREGSPLAAPAPLPSDGSGDEGVMIGALFGAFVIIALLLWAGIWYHR